MNERIKELAIQAGFFYEDYKDIWYLEYHNETCEEELKKFAELIVWECMRMCEVAEMGFETHGCSVEASGAITVKEYIAEHFGVGE